MLNIKILKLAPTVERTSVVKDRANANSFHDRVSEDRKIYEANAEKILPTLLYKKAPDECLALNMRSY